MSTTAAPAAGAAPAAASPAPTKIASEIRRRAQGLPPLDPEAAAAKAESDRKTAEAKAATDKAAADAAKAEADRKAAEAAGAPPPVVEKVKKVKAGPALPEPEVKPGKTVEELVREVLPVITKESAAASAAPQVSPEIERELEIAAFAAKRHPEKYAGQAEKIIGFYESRDALLAQKAKELGGAASDDYKEWLKGDELTEWVRSNRPGYQRGDAARIQEEMIADRAKAEARAEMEPQLRELERRTLTVQHEPEINARVGEAMRIIITDASEQKDPALVGFVTDAAKFGADHPEEARLIAGEANEAAELIREVYRVDRRLVEFDPKRPTDLQRQVGDFMRAKNVELQKQFPTGLERPDGTILIDAQTYEARGLAKDKRYRTFNADDVAGMMAAERNAALRAKLASRREGVAKSVYAAKPAPAPADGQSAEVAAKPGEAAPSPEAPGSRPTGQKGKPAAAPWDTVRNKYLNGK